MFVGMQLNSVILVMGSMMQELKNMISAPNVNKASEERKRSLLLVLVIIFLISAPVYVGYFLPQFNNKPT
jgi:hypothetical protein